MRERMARAAQSAGRSVDSVELIAVSKTYDTSAIEPIIAAGQKLFGENRVQEAKAKWPELKAKHPDVQLHLIGPLQSNKAKEAVALFDAIQTVDRDKIAKVLSEELRKQERGMPVFIQINTGAEPQKAGVLPQEADEFIQRCRQQYSLEIVGLMCIPPVEENPALHFALLEKIAKRNGLAQLSMGMSGDFETAITLGATYIRVGSAIFGARDYSKA